MTLLAPTPHARETSCASVGMASLVCLVSGPDRNGRKITLRLAAIRRAKVGYRQIQRHNQMALSAAQALTLAIDRQFTLQISTAKLLTKDEARRIAANIAKLLPRRLERAISTLA